MTPERRSFRAWPLPRPARRWTLISTISMENRPSDEERADGCLVVGTPDRLAEKRGDRENAQFADLRRFRPERNRVGDDQLVETRVGEAFDGRPRQHGMGRAG